MDSTVTALPPAPITEPAPIDRFYVARKAMLEAWRAVVGSRVSADDLTDELVSTCEAMLYLIQLDRRSAPPQVA